MPIKGDLAPLTRNAIAIKFTTISGKRTAQAQAFTDTWKWEDLASIARQGYDVIADIGDQWSDVCGGYADHIYKLPNPTYYLP